ncbi:MAG: response regulator, partial [Ignavibacteriae bacterium]|nr:response regulator [Ignavibacteriota bacterium]
MDESVSILLIIEDRTLTLYLKAVLAKWYPDTMIYVAEEGWDGWENIVNNKPKLIISDLNIPGMNGIQICKKLREINEFKDIYFIILTAIIEKAQRTLALQEGADDYLNKPFVEEELKTKLSVAFRIIDLQSKMTGDNQLLHDIAEQLQQDIKDFQELSFKFCQSRFPAYVEMLRRVSEASKWIAKSFGDIEE